MVRVSVGGAGSGIIAISSRFREWGSLASLTSNGHSI